MAKTASNLTRKLVNPPLISLAHTPNIDVTVASEFWAMHAPGLSKNEDGNVTVLTVVNNETGEESHLLSNTVLQSTLERMPGGYVGKRFQIEAGPIREDKGYRSVKVWEVTAE